MNKLIIRYTQRAGTREEETESAHENVYKCVEN